MPDSVRALAIYEGRLALVRRKRPDCEEDGDKPFAKLVGGHIELGESPYEAALRYVEDALGLVPRAMYPAGAIRTHRRNRRYIFVMDGVRPDDVIAGTGIAEVVWCDVRCIPEDWPNFRAIQLALMLSDVH